MKILVVGGAGYVGSICAELLLDEAHQVAVFDNLTEGHRRAVDDRATFIEGDLFTADISQATVVTLWLTASVNARLTPKLFRELKPGARIVARQFPLAVVPDRAETVDGEDLFLWTIPPR